jgi:hypothetical protein
MTSGESFSVQSLYFCVPNLCSEDLGSRSIALGLVSAGARPWGYDFCRLLSASINLDHSLYTKHQRDNLSTG